MATVANSKNTFSKRMEITQIGSHQSESRLQSVFLDKPENYTLQIERFIVDTTPTINLIEGPYFQILERPGYDETVGGNQNGFFELDNVSLAIPIDFTPATPKSILDVFHQLEVFCKDHPGLDVTISPDYKLSFSLSAVYGDTHYLKLNTVFADLIQLPEYIYYFRRHNRIDEPQFSDAANTVTVVSYLQQSGNGYTQNNLLFYGDADAANDVQIFQSLLFGDEPVFAQSADPAGLPDVSIQSLDTLRSLDTRLSYDVSCSFPSDSKVEVLQGDGNYRRLLARFPIGDVLEDYTSVSSNEDYMLTEKINVGVTDITRSNPNTQTLNLHQGEIQNVKTDINVRYVEGKKMKRVPAEFGDTGFFTLGLLFSKRIK